MLHYVINLITLHTGALKDLIINFFLNLLDLIIKLTLSLNIFDSMVAVVFQIIFRAEIHVNDVFSFFKNYF